MTTLFLETIKSQAALLEAISATHVQATLLVVCDETQPGEDVFVVGSVPALGNWAPERAVKLTSTPATWPVWVAAAAVELPASAKIELKCVRHAAGTPLGAAVWEPLTKNRKIVLSPLVGHEILVDLGRFGAKDAVLLLPVVASPPRLVRVMTWNVRYDTPDDGANRWSARRDAFCDAVRARAPLVAAFQEVLPGQFEDLCAALCEAPGAAAFGAYAEAREFRGEACAIFWAKARFVALERDTFWLCPPGDDGGERRRALGWDAACVRICSWVRLYDKLLRRTMLVFNAHLDHRGGQAQLEGLRLVRRRIAATKRNPLEPVVLMGDFNCAPASAPIAECAAELLYARDAPGAALAGPAGTFHNFGAYEAAPWTLDYVFVDKQSKCREYAVVHDNRLSDHDAVVAVLELDL